MLSHKSFHVNCSILPATIQFLIIAYFTSPCFEKCVNFPYDFLATEKPVGKISTGLLRLDAIGALSASTLWENFGSFLIRD